MSRTFPGRVSSPNILGDRIISSFQPLISDTLSRIPDPSNLFYPVENIHAKIFIQNFIHKESEIEFNLHNQIILHEIIFNEKERNNLDSNSKKNIILIFHQREFTYTLFVYPFKRNI